MKKALIAELFEKFEKACYIFPKGMHSQNYVECWSARELQEVLNYSEWRNFIKVVEKAKNACLNAGENVTYHFVDINKMVLLGSGAERNIDDINFI